MAELYFNNQRCIQIDIIMKNGGIISFKKEGVTTNPPTDNNFAINTGYKNINCNEVSMSTGVDSNNQFDIIFQNRSISNGKDILVSKLALGIKQYFIDRILGWYESPVELYRSD